MTTLLLKLFVKNYKNTKEQQVRTSYGVLASIVGIILNIILALTKFIISLLISSISIMADSFNNLSDAVSSIVSLIGVKLAGRPADKEHPFGHGRFEYVAALIVSFLIFLVGVTLFKDSIKKIFKPEDLGFSWIIITILILSVLTKIWLSYFNHKLGKKINSGLLKATSVDARNDVIVTIVTIISVFLCHFTGLKIDGYMGVLVSLFVLYSGFNIAKETLLPLIGQGVERDLYEKITKKVESYDGIIGSHDLIMHNYGPSHIMGTIHVEVSNEETLEDVHHIIDRIERDILRDMGIFIVIHVDPTDTSDTETVNGKKVIENVVKELEPEAHIHDFRILKDKKHLILIFDLVVPHEYNDENKNELLIEIESKVCKIDERYKCNVTIEKSYISY